MPVNPRSLENLRTIRLESGVTSETHRVRAAADVQAWFRRMSAETRGELLARVMADESAAAAAPAPAPAADVLDGVSALDVLSAVIPQPLRNRLRWTPARYAAMEAHLASGAALLLDESGARPVWRTASGESIRPETVRRLTEGGVLRRR